MSHITANDLKTRGVAAIESALADGAPAAIVSVRGANRYVVMEIGQYHRLRASELEAALAETKAELAAGRYVVEPAESHVQRLRTLLAAEERQTPAPPKRAAGARASTRRKR